MDRSELKYGTNWSREAEDRLLDDMGIAGGQGRTPEDVQSDAGSGLAIALIVGALLVLGLLAGCSTVEGLGDDLSALSRGVRAEMAKE